MSRPPVIHVGLIGAGNLARTRAKCMKEIPEVRLCAVASRTKDKAQQFAEEHHIPMVCANHHELLTSKVDAVIVATPNDTHYEIVMDALRAGKDVLVEYPMVLYSAQASEIVGVVEEEKAILEVGFDSRFDPLDRKMREVVRNGQIGEPVWCSAQLLYPVDYDPGKWYGREESTRGMIVSWLVERFDLLHRLCGEIRSVFAAEAPDIYSGKTVCEQRNCVLNLQFQSGAVGMIGLCCLAPRGLSGSIVQVIGREGALRCDGQTLTTLTHCGEKMQQAEPGCDAFMEETSHFMGCVRERAPVENPPANSLEGLRVAEAALESLHGGAVESLI